MVSGGGARVGVWAIVALVRLLIAEPALGEPALTLTPPIAVEASLDWVPRAVSAADIATDGVNSLIVYSGYAGNPTNVGYIMARRVNAAGVPADPLPFEMYSGLPILYLRVVFDGTGYVVLWAEGVAGDYSLRFMRVKADGDLVTAPKTLEEGSNWIVPAIAGGETGAFVVRGSTDGCRTWVLTRDATVEGDSIELDHFASPYAAFSDGVWLVAYTTVGDGNSQFVQFGGDGQIVAGTTSSAAAAPYAGSHSIAPAPDGFVVSRELGGAGGQIDFVHVDFDGATVVEPYAITSAQQSLGPHPHSLIATSNGYALLYNAVPLGCDTCFWNGWLQLLTSALEPITPEPVKLRDGANTLVAAALADGASPQLVWQGSYGDLRVAPLALGDHPSLGKASPVSLGLSDQRSPRVAVGRTGWLASWTEWRIPMDGGSTNEARVSGVLIDDSGHPIGQPVILFPDYEGLSNLVRGPDGWLLSGGDGNHFDLRHVSNELHVTTVAVSDAPLQSDEKIASSPFGWIVTWLEADEVGVSLRAARLDAAGMLVDSTTLLSKSAPIVEVQALYRDGSYEVLWANAAKDIFSVQLPAAGSIPILTPQTFLETEGYPGGFEIARVSNGWWGWVNVNNSNSFRTASGKVFPEAGFPTLPIVEVDGLALTGVQNFPDGLMRIGLAPEEGPLNYLATVSGSTSADLSNAVDHRALLATLETSWIMGEPTQRIWTRIVTVSGGIESELGGAGGVGGTGSGAGAGSGEGGTAEATAGAEEAGGSLAGAGDSQAIAGAPSDLPTGGSGESVQPDEGGVGSISLGGAPLASGNAGNARDSAALVSRGPRTSSSCGCRIAGGNEGNTSLAASLALSLAMWRRWRRQRKRNGAGGCAADP